MTGPATIDANTRSYSALMATLLRTQPVQTGTPGTGHSGDLIPFDAGVRAMQASAKRNLRVGA